MAPEVNLGLRAALTIRDLLSEAGFENIKEEIRKHLMGPWAKDGRLKEAGRYDRCNALALRSIFSACA